MAGRLSGKRVLITGTGGGQGEEALRLFAAEGARLAGCDVTPGLAEQAAERLRCDGFEVEGETVDLGVPEQASAWIRSSADRLGGIDVLYNNAGAARFAPIDEMDLDDWDFVIRNELSLVFYVTRAAWPHLVASRGSIITTASVAGVMGFAPVPSAAHAAAKGGLIALTRQLAAEGGVHGVRANTISPGYVVSPATEASRDDDTIARVLDELLLRRLGTTVDTASLALFLASDESSWITGANIPVDGGFLAGRPATAIERSSSHASS